MDPIIIIAIIVGIGVVLFFIKKGGCGSCGCHSKEDPASDKKADKK